MMDGSVTFDERYDDEENEATTLYFTAPKELLKKMTSNNYPEAVSMEISVEFPTAHIEPDCASVCISPTNADGEDYDWTDTELTYNEINDLISLAEEK